MLKLLRLNISFMVVLSAYFGFYISGGVLDLKAIAVLFAVLLHSFGNSVINQVQERKIDRVMLRTMDRPVATGRVKAGRALIYGLSLITFSLIIPLITGDYLIAGLLVINLIIYNFIYTPMKRKNSYALLIGSICGALPPIIGWGIYHNPDYFSRVVLVAAIFYLWQVPHFMFLTEKYSDEYKKAGLKILINDVEFRKYFMILLVWVLCYFFALVYAVILLLQNVYVKIVVISFELIIVMLIITFLSKRPGVKFAFINLSILVFVFSFFL